ncbi:hypothetical protein, variant 2 [Aphanomyces astaci]|nr:hypothetical protein, variant 2 [Aphanomyces astaci]ETV78269.1 hypothetical protein, variant 2 [Aphanomyces astaci]|eukprot:XP_009832604.1 hypothetical protein, variant 2 [Aphanomyces astaci]
MDISTDLMELSRTPVAVVCAGVKSILDIPRTLEFLETYAVPVVGYQTRAFPAFFTTSSGGAQAHIQLNTPQEVASLIKTSQDLNLPNGFLVAVPNPAPVDSELIHSAIQDGLQECRDEHIAGNAVTPFLLKRVNELTQGVSLTSNIALVKNNALVGAKIAVALAATLSAATPPHTPASSCREASSSSHASARPSHSSTPDVVVVGGAVLDVISKPTTQFIRGTSNIGLTKQTWGGVGRNVAECLHRLDVPVLLVSNIGKDACGHGLLRQLDSLHMDPSGVISSSAHATATYCAVLNSSGDLDVAIADMAILHDLEWDDTAAAKMDTARVVVFDGNLSPAKMARVTRPPQPKSLNPRRLLWFEPTSVEKAVRVTAVLHRVHVVSPNVDELRAMCEALPKDTGRVDQGLAAAAARLLPVDNGPQVIRDVATVARCMRGDNDEGDVHVVVTMGRHGVLVGTTSGHVNVADERDATLLGKVGDLTYVYLPGIPMAVANCTGAGDSFVGGAVYGLLQGYDIVRSSKLGMIAARKSIGSEFPIHPNLSPHDFA